jgi:hypothetical protein
MLTLAIAYPIWSARLFYKNVSYYYDRLCGLVVKSFWLQTQKFRVGFSALHVLSISGSGTGQTQLREDK